MTLEESKLLQAELERLRKLLESQLALQASEQAIAATRRAIADCIAALRSNGIELDDDPLDQPLALHHQQTISGNVQVGVAVSGNVNAPISHHTHHHHQKRDPIDLAKALSLLAELPTDHTLLPSNELPLGSRVPPLRSNHFVGRERDLLALAAQLKAGKACVISTGIGGMGKSTLASEFVYRYGCYFVGGVYWLSFADLNAIESEIAACGSFAYMQLYHETEELSLQERCARVLAAGNESIPRLLVFDNWDHVDERTARELLERYLPKAGGSRVLITSRNYEWPSDLAILPMRLGLLSRNESINLLRSYRSDISDTDANAIAQELGDLPLALTLAGPFLERYCSSNYGAPQSYLGNLRSRMLDHRSMKDEQRGLRASFGLSFERLRPSDEIDRLAIAALVRASYFAPNEAIPHQLLEATLGEFDPEDEELALLRTDALKRLLELGLLEQVDQSSLRIHRLIATYAQTTIDDESAQEQVEQILIAETLSKLETGVPSRLDPLLNHLRHVYQAHIELDDLHSAELAMVLGRAEQKQINYDAAEILYQRALKIREQLLGEEHPDTAQSLHSLGALCQAQGYYKKAEIFYQQALMIRKQVLGSKHSDTASSINNLATVYRVQGNLTEAKPLYQQALEIREEVLGNQHPDTAISLSGLAYWYYLKGEYENAETLYKRALTIRSAVLGDKHPLTALSISYLSRLYLAQQRYAEAERFSLMALKIHEEVLGSQHPYTATSLNHIAMLYRSLDRYQEAEDYYQRALAIRQQALGIQHPLTGIVRANLARLYHRKGQYTEAASLLQESLTIFEQMLNVDHRYAEHIRDSIARCQYLASQLAQAEAEVEQVLTGPVIDYSTSIQEFRYRAEWYGDGEEEEEEEEE